MNTEVQAAIQSRVVSVVIPARNEAGLIGDVLRSVQCQSVPATDVEIIVVDDGSTDDTVARARAAGVQVIEARQPGEAGNPAAARNRGAAASRGDPIVFLDADCVVADGWLAAILAAHGRGATIVGGALALPPGLPISARCDYYCGWYLIHPRARGGWVPHHPPPNLSVRRGPFLSTGGFSTQPPLDYTNEERLWEGQLRALGHRIYFEPRAVASHHNRPGFRNLLRRHYRWGYTAVEAKSQSGAARLAWLYRYPWLLVVASPALVLAHTTLILLCWVRAGVFEPLWMSPAILASRVTYVAGLCTGALRWLKAKQGDPGAPRPRPRWQ
jgi:glycosyltransferase involved in cell wall biosynthesis